MTRNEYLQLPELDKRMFICKMIHAMIVDEACFGHANRMVELAENKGALDNVKFGNEVYKETVD